MEKEKAKPTYTSNLRQFSGMTFKLEEVYMDYRTGWFEKDGKNLSRTFKKFPITSVAKYVNWSEEIKNLPKYSETKELEYREQIWNEWTCEFHKVSQDSIDTKVFKKVFDIRISFPETIEVVKYVKDGQEVKESNFSVVVQGVSASKVKDMIRAVVDEPIPMKEGKDRATWEKIMKEVYGFEDTMKELLKGKFVKMKVSGQGMDTKYIYSEGKTFKSMEEVLGDIPF